MDDPKLVAASRPEFAPYVPDAREVQTLIAAAGMHPLGLEFLLHGDPSAVAITFQVHQFAVEAARRQLGPRDPGATPGGGRRAPAGGD